MAQCISRPMNRAGPSPCLRRANSSRLSRLSTVAVTGTNGKTSTVELTRQLWRIAGHRAASIGTLGVTTGDEQVRTGLTTPDIVTFLANMAGLAREGVTHAAFEASSHGLDQFRTEGLPVAAAAFTNLSRDHLDYHHDMAAYLTAKLRLFAEVVGDDGTVVVWQDDEASDRVIDLARARGLRLVGVGARGGTLRLLRRVPTQLGQELTIEHDGVEYRISLPLIGAYQSANALTAAGLVIATGGDVRQTLKALERVQPVRGRLERAVISRAGTPVYVDYAHTPDALAAAISALKPHALGRLILVFGAGGDRDQGKRAEMGLIAEAMADRVIVTDDNPRTEDPAHIRAAILAKAPEATEIGDRRDGDCPCHRRSRAAGHRADRRQGPRNRTDRSATAYCPSTTCRSRASARHEPVDRRRDRRRYRGECVRRLYRRRA